MAGSMQVMDLIKNLVSPTPQNKTNKINLSPIFNSSYENPNIN